MSSLQAGHPPDGHLDPNGDWRRVPSMPRRSGRFGRRHLHEGFNSLGGLPQSFGKRMLQQGRALLPSSCLPSSGVPRRRTAAWRCVSCVPPSLNEWKHGVWRLVARQTRLAIRQGQQVGSTRCRSSMDRFRPRTSAACRAVRLSSSVFRRSTRKQRALLRDPFQLLAEPKRHRLRTVEDRPCSIWSLTRGEATIVHDKLAKTRGQAVSRRTLAWTTSR